MDQINFDAAFQALTDNPPFPWQRALYQRFLAGDFPSSCNLPTGLGKTSVIHIWLLALANAPDRVPRRLAYVVNRRTVVDQSTTEAEKLRERIKEVPQLRDRLAQLCSNLDGKDLPLAISTLRGQFADNREWSADPARPAVIAGTVDMIGSRLLFSGYGIGFKMKPLHAGFLGQDALLVHDEAHLEPAFQALIEAIRDEQQKEPAPLGERMRLRVMALTATQRGSVQPFELTDDEKAGKVPVVSDRLLAKKGLLTIACKRAEVATEIARRALRHKDAGKAVLVFVRTIEDVKSVCQQLTEKNKGVSEKQVQTLTGTLRGRERDLLTRSDAVFARFMPEPKSVPAEGAVYLVCTSAGEVGIDISADHMVSDLTPLDSMAQRFGRVNRRGGGAAEIDVIYESDPDAKKKDDPLERARWATLPHLQHDLPACDWIEGRREARPQAIGALIQGLTEQQREATFSPQPVMLPTSDILFDAWALTTIREKLPGRPPVEPYLRGLRAWEPPETHVAWREEVGRLWPRIRNEAEREELETKARNRLSKLAPDLLDDYPLKPHELLRDLSYRVFKELAKIAARCPNCPAWLVDQDGTVEVMTLKELAGKDEKARIERRMVVLPPKAGGLEGGLLKGDSEITAGLDVADQWFVDREEQVPRRKRVREDEAKPKGVEEMRLVHEIDLKPGDDEAEDSAEDEQSDEGEKEEKGHYWRWYVRPQSADDDSQGMAQEPVKWDAHTRQVTRNAKWLVGALGLPAEMQKAIIFAAQCHDLGKRREVWQRSIGNPSTKDWCEKPGKGWRPIELTRYRHEFGSLLDLDAEIEWGGLSEPMKDLVRHVIVAHHGRARPHFPMAEAFDPEPKEGWTEKRIDGVAAQVPQRFARLQRRYGRWGLAYLESLLRAADHAASARPEVTREGAP